MQFATRCPGSTPLRLTTVHDITLPYETDTISLTTKKRERDMTAEIVRPAGRALGRVMLVSAIVLGARMVRFFIYGTAAALVFFPNSIRA